MSWVFFYVPCFLAGVIAFATDWQPRLRGWMWLPFLTLLTVAFVRLSPGTSLLDPFVCLVLGLAIPLFREIRNIQVARAAAFIAKYSYGIYLAHLGMYQLAFGALRLSPILGTGVAVALTVCISMLAYALVEQPCIKLGASIADRFVAQSATRSIVIGRPEREPMLDLTPHAD